MNNIPNSNTLELILNNLLSTNPETKIIFYLNTPNKTELTSVDTTFSLSVTGSCSINGVSNTADATLEVLLNEELPIDINSTSLITIPELEVTGSTTEQIIPITLDFSSSQSFDYSGIAKGVLPEINIDTTIPKVDITLPLNGEATGNIQIDSINTIKNPELIVSGKTGSTILDVDVIGYTSQDLKIQGTVTGVIPQLKVSGNTSKTQVELTSTGNSNGYLPPTTITGVTTSEKITIPLLEDMNCSFSVMSSGQLTIPNLPVSLKTPSHESTVHSQINDTISLNVVGSASGTIPETTLTTHTPETIIHSDVSGKSTGLFHFKSTEDISVPPLSLIGKTKKLTIPVTLNGTSKLNNTIKGTASGKLSTCKITGTATFDTLPVSGTISSKPNFTSKQPIIVGHIASIDCGLVLINEDITNNIVTLEIDSISYITFKTKHSKIATNKFAFINSTRSLEKALVNIWDIEGNLQFYGRNTTNPLDKIINTSDIKYINKGIMWSEEYLEDGILNIIFTIDNLIGFSQLN